MEKTVFVFEKSSKTIVIEGNVKPTSDSYGVEFEEGITEVVDDVVVHTYYVSM